jgi:lysozyme family protein
MSEFLPAFLYLMGNEQGLSENPNDKGGITNDGISLRFLKTLSQERLHAYGIFDIEVNEDTIRHLTLDHKKAIYKGEFWDHAPFEKINNQFLTNYIFDMAINTGIAPAIKALQRACWAIHKRWQDLPDDGILGDKTLDIVNQTSFIIMPMRAERGSYYRAIINHDPTQKEFLTGWYNRTYNI